MLKSTIRRQSSSSHARLLSRAPHMLLVAALAAGSVLAGSAAADDELRPLAGDPVNGKKIFQKASKKSVRVDGNWMNARSDAALVAALKAGQDGMPKIKSESTLDIYDVVAYLRSTNADLRTHSGDATHALVATGTYDQYALERLKDRVGVVPAEKERTLQVFALYTLEAAQGDEVVLIDVKDNKKRDQLKPKLKSGYLVVMPLKGVRDGGYEAAIAVDKDILITSVEIIAPDGTRPDDLNQVAARVVGKGGRGKYDGLKLVGAGMAVRDLEKPLSEAFLLGMEAVYMYEVSERDYFAFDE
jgi:hypothetical protein